MQIVTASGSLRECIRAWRRRGETIGFVPTMGFLHEGHTSLMDLARPRCDHLVVSIFVNPLQFGPSEDLDRYPRDPEGDERKCREAGVELLFVPDAFYPEDFSTTVSVSGVTEGLCGDRRPGHFEGVTTVVARLFGMVQPQIAVFGEKDYQQLQVIRRMVRDLAMDIDVVGGPLVRDTDGLALSSRNAYLSAEQRRRGLSLSRSLLAMRAAVADGTRDVETLLVRGRQVLDADQVDYLAVVDAEDLTPLEVVDRPARALGAAFFGSTRLIDNLSLEL